MRNIYWVILLLLPLSVNAKLTKQQLEEAVNSVYHTQFVPNPVLECFEAEGHVSLVRKIRATNGFLEPETGYEFLPILLGKLETNQMQASDEYRFALIGMIMYSAQVFNYEYADEVAEKVLDNIDKYISDKVERSGWEILVRLERPNYKLSDNSWVLGNLFTQTYYLLKQSSNLNPNLRLALLENQEIGYNSNRLQLSDKEFDYMISEIDRMISELYPNLPHIMEMREPYHVASRITRNPQFSLVDRMKLQRLIREGNLDPCNSVAMVYFMACIAASTGANQELESLMEELLRRYQEIIARQENPTTINASYILNELFYFDFKQLGVITTESDDKTERFLLDRLIAKIDQSKIGKRCKALVYASYASERTGTTVALTLEDLGRKYMASVENDTYDPYINGALCDAAMMLFHGGHTDEAVDMLNNLTENANLSPKAAAHIYNSLAESIAYKGDSLAIVMKEKAAENLCSEKRLDHFALSAIYGDIISYYTNINHKDKLSKYIRLLETVRSASFVDEWYSESDWIIARAKAYMSSNPKRELRRLYEKATKLSMYPYMFSFARELCGFAYDEENYAEIQEYMEICYQIYKLNPYEFGDYTFISGYLNYLYNQNGDRVAWRNVLSDVINFAETNHFDLNIAFIQMICTQGANVLYSGNFLDANYCAAVAMAKANAIRGMIPDDDNYAMYNLMYSIMPFYSVYAMAILNMWDTAQKNLNEHQRLQLTANGSPEMAGEQALALLDETIRIQENLTVSNEEYLTLRASRSQLLISMGRVEEAVGEFAELEQWSMANSVNEQFDYLTKGVKLDIAMKNGDVEQWIDLVDNEQFWDLVEKRQGNIDAISRNMRTLIQYYSDKNENARAQEIAKKRFALVKDFVDSQYVMLSEAQRSVLIDNGTVSPQDIYWLLSRVDAKADKELLTMAYDASLYYKNLFLESNNVLRSAVYNSGDSIQIADYEKFISMQKQFDITKANLLYSDTRKSMREYRALEDSIQNRAIKSGLLELSRRFQTRDVAKALTSDEAAIEFTAGENEFGALILRKGDKSPRYVKLISYDELNECMEPLKSSGSKIAPKIKRIYSGTSKRGKQLYNKLWHPLEAHLKGVNRIYYSPVGNLSTVAFGALQDSTLTAVAERYDMRLVSTTATVLKNKRIKKQKQKASNISALAIGDVTYEADSTMVRRNWLKLENSLKEVEHFDSICCHAGINCQLMTAYDATESALRSISGNSPSIILLSSHGFYHSAERASVEPFYINKGLTHDLDSVSPNHMIMPLKRGGLVLANANIVWNNDYAVDDEIDGILTAEEISQLDLTDTELLVLSACETGLGESTLSEGINGLQRGIKLAGVKSVILSLWEVNDKASREFMEEFYVHLFSSGDRHEAYRKAMLLMRERYPKEPAYWAMFVMLD